jgi:hypothetical protein
LVWQNVITFNGNDDDVGPSNQVISALTNISAFNVSHRWAHVNLTDAYYYTHSRSSYASAVSHYVRGFALDSDFATLVVKDSFTPLAKAGAVNVTWAMHTKASIVVDADGRGATLAQGGQTLRVLCGDGTPAGAKFVAQEIHLKAPQHPSDGLRKLLLETAVHGPNTVELAVAFKLATTTTPSSPRTNELSEWVERGAFAL